MLYKCAGIYLYFFSLKALYIPQLMHLFTYL